MSSDATAFGFGKFIPGFDFLQGLASGAGAAAQPLGKVPEWVAPTVSIEEVDKRIAELKAVQFWLEQNSRALAATIQALEVQRMTLATLKGMNVSMAELAKSFTFPPGAAGAAHNAFADAMSWGKAQNPSPESAAASDYSHWPMGGGQEAAAGQPEPAPKAEGEEAAGARAGRKAAKEVAKEAVQEAAARPCARAVWSWPSATGPGATPSRARRWMKRTTRAFPISPSASAPWASASPRRATARAFFMPTSSGSR